MTRLLHDIAYVRSGDKGDICTIGVIARSEAAYQDVLRSVTPERVKALFGDWVTGEVTVYRLDNLHALSVVMRGALGGGASRTLRFDVTGKALGTALLRLPIIDAE